MSATLIPLLGCDVLAAITPDAYTTTPTGSAIDLAPYAGSMHFILASKAASAADTLDGKLTECDTSGGTYTDVTGGAFTQVTDASTGATLLQTLTIPKSKLKRFVKAVGTIAGSSVSIPCVMLFIARNKYQA